MAKKKTSQTLLPGYIKKQAFVPEVKVTVSGEQRIRRQEKG